MPRDNWRTIFIIAQEDQEVFHKLVHAEGIPLRISCFHAQQAVEKYFKSVIGSRGIDYPYTHDLIGLTEILEKHGFVLPLPIEKIAKLNPFAVQVRYDLPPIIPVRPEEIKQIVDSVAHWCKEQIHD